MTASLGISVLCLGSAFVSACHPSPMTSDLPFAQAPEPVSDTTLTTPSERPPDPSLVAQRTSSTLAVIAPAVPSTERVPRTAPSAPPWCTNPTSVGQLVVLPARLHVQGHDAVGRGVAQPLNVNEEATLYVVGRGCHSTNTTLASRQAITLQHAGRSWDIGGAMCLVTPHQPSLPDCNAKVLSFSLGKLTAGTYVVRAGELELQFSVPMDADSQAATVGAFLQ